MSQARCHHLELAAALAVPVAAVPVAAVPVAAVPVAAVQVAAVLAAALAAAHQHTDSRHDRRLGLFQVHDVLASRYRYRRHNVFYSLVYHHEGRHHNVKLKPTHWIAIALAGVSVADLATGNTNKPLLPAVLGNYLTQQIDIVLLVIAGVLFFFT